MDDNLYAPPRSRVADFAPSGSVSLYSPRQIYTAAFLSGPFAGAWFLSRNFHFFKGWRSWLKVVGVSLAWLALTLMVWSAAWILTARLLPNLLPK
jgi:hypothetical protein